MGPMTLTPAFPVLSSEFQEQGNNEGEDEEEEDEGDEEEDEEVDTLNYLQPVPTRKRRALLRASGVRRIDALEKDECRDIRASREFCGCTCKGRCLPDSCSCSLAGIACQVGGASVIAPHYQSATEYLNRGSAIDCFCYVGCCSGGGFHVCREELAQCP